MSASVNNFFEHWTQMGYSSICSTDVMNRTTTVNSVSSCSDVTSTSISAISVFFVSTTMELGVVANFLTFFQTCTHKLLVM